VVSQHSAISKLAAVKQSREVYHHIHALKGTNMGTSISQVEVTGETGPQLISGQCTVEQALCHSLQQCFMKVHGSPFLSQPLLQDVGFLGYEVAAQEMLEGTYQCPPGTDEYTWLFIEALCWPAI